MVNYAKKSVIFGYLHTSHTSLQLTFTFAKFSNPKLNFLRLKMKIWPRCSELLCMNPADLVVFSPSLFLELLNPNLWSAEGAGPTLKLPKNGPGYPPGLNLNKAVPSLLQILGIKNKKLLPAS